MKYLGKSIVALAILMSSHVAYALDELNIAYFLEWPTANQVAQVNKTFDKEMGLKVNWRSFDNGNAMTAAMLAGDIDIAYSQGFVPFVVAVSKGVDLKLIGIAMTYAENDNCVVHKDAGITKANAKALEGKKIGTPTGNVTHYKLLKTLKHLGVDSSKAKILSMANSDVSAAFARGDITMGCAFGGPLTRLKEYGKVLMTGAEQEAIGLKVFDIVSVTGKFAKENPGVVTQFMQITENANRAYNKMPSKYYDTLAKAAGMKKQATIDTLNKFTFLSKEQQLSKDWMHGGIADFTKEVADFFVAENEIPKALSKAQYAKTIDSSFLMKVK